MKRKNFALLLISAVAFFSLGLAACSRGDSETFNRGDEEPSDLIEGLYFSENSDGYALVAIDRELDEIVIPETYRGKAVTEIRSQAFQQSDVKKVEIPESVLRIESAAFSECNRLESIVLPEKVTAIEVGLFYGCTSLKSVNIGSDVTYIGHLAFAGCESLENIDIPDATTEIGIYAFFNCSSLQSVTFGAGVKTIGASTFENCSRLKEIVLPEGVQSIDLRAFYECASLTKVTIPKTVSSIGQSAFQGTAVEEVHLSDIAAWCTVSFGLILGDKPDMSCWANPFHNGADLYLNGEMVTHLVIPDSVNEIGSYAFFHCRSIKTVEFGSGIEKIGDFAFTFSYLESVTYLGIRAEWEAIEKGTSFIPERCTVICADDPFEEITLENFGKTIKNP